MRYASAGRQETFKFGATAFFGALCRTVDVDTRGTPLAPTSLARQHVRRLPCRFTGCGRALWVVDWHFGDTGQLTLWVVIFTNPALYHLGCVLRSLPHCDRRQAIGPIVVEDASIALSSNRFFLLKSELCKSGKGTNPLGRTSLVEVTHCFDCSPLSVSHPFSKYFSWWRSLNPSSRNPSSPKPRRRFLSRLKSWPPNPSPCLYLRTH